MAYLSNCISSPLAHALVLSYQDVLLKLVSFKLKYFEPLLKSIITAIWTPTSYVCDGLLGLPEADVEALRAP